MREAKWNLYVKGLQQHFGACSGGHTIEKLKFITELMPPDKYNKVLDIGVGEGLETSVLKQLGYNPTGIISGDDNKKWAKEHYPDIEFVACDMHDLPFPDNSFDAIYTNQVLEHAFAPFIFLLECYCVLRPGGLLYASMPEFKERTVPDSPKSLEASHISHHHPSIFSRNIWRQLFERTGFTVIKDKPVGKMEFLVQKGEIEKLHSDVIGVVNKRNHLNSITKYDIM